MNTTRTTTVSCPNCGRGNRIPVAAEGRPKCGHCKQPLPWIVDAGDDDFAEIADNAAQPVVVDLWATWCGPCRMVSPALERLATERAGLIKLVKVDIDTAPAIARRFGVQAVPTLLILHDGEVAARQAGAAPLPTLRSWVDGALGSDGGPAG